MAGNSPRIKDFWRMEEEKEAKSIFCNGKRIKGPLTLRNKSGESFRERYPNTDSVEIKKKRERCRVQKSKVMSYR